MTAASEPSANKEHAADARAEKVAKYNKGGWVLGIFVAFFGTIILLDVSFAYIAVHSQPGVIAEHTYEKGLAYDHLLAEAKNQPHLQDKPLFKDSVLQWRLIDENGKTIDNATAKVLIVREVRDGYDFHKDLTADGNGLYTAKLDLPLNGAWTARLETEWINKDSGKKLSYRRIYKFIAE